VFTAEVEGVGDDKLKIAGDSFDVKTLVANKGDKVTVKFYNVDEVQTERNSFTIGDPYRVDSMWGLMKMEMQHSQLTGGLHITPNIICPLLKDNWRYCHRGISLQF
jgi:hypothetical protein